MKYAVKELYYTLQGEGVNAGRAAVFLRFAGCNLWSGLEKDRPSAVCQFCDTNFVGADGPGGRLFESAKSVATAVSSSWPWRGRQPCRAFVVCTGGEPLLQLDPSLVTALHDARFEIAIETNGTRLAPDGIDWICVSPKAGAQLILLKGNELKLVFPQEGAEPELYEHLDFDHFLLQPLYGPRITKNTEQALAYCKAHPLWRLSLQIHKTLRIP